MDTHRTSEFLKALRRAKGFTQEEVANRLYLSPKTISRWESGAGIPDINIIESVAALYDVTVDEILKGERRTERNENLSEQTKKLKDDGAARALSESVIKSYNRYWLFALGVLALFAIFEIIFIGALSLILLPVGVIISAVIVCAGNMDVKRVLGDSSEILSDDYKVRVERLIRSKNLIFTDIAVLLALIFLFFFTGLIGSLAGVQIIILIAATAVIAACYIAVRIFLTKNVASQNRQMFVRVLSVIAFVLGLFGIIFLFNVSVSVSNDFGTTLAKYGMPAPSVFFIDYGEWLFKAISICLLALSVAAFIFGTIRASVLGLSCGMVFGIASVLIISGSPGVNFRYVHPAALAMLVAAIVILIVIGANKLKLKRESKAFSPDGKI